MNRIDFDIIDSTNTYLKDHYRELDDMTFVSAKAQTCGRGRSSRIWSSEKGSNLLFSLLLCNKSFFRNYETISIVSAYSVVEILREYGLKPFIKWPNDVYVEDKKICGILLESVIQEDFKCLIIGVGLNVNQKKFVGDYLIEPTSLSNVLNKEINLNDLKDRIYNKFESNLFRILNNESFYEDIKEIDYLKGKNAYALINDKKRKIKVLGINVDYSLKIEYDNKIKDIKSGEISFHL